MAASSTVDEESFSLASEVRGHLVYKHVWTPEVEQLLQVQAEAANTEDPHTVATILNGEIVGHVPREISRLSFYFLQHGGTIICEITGARRHSEVLDKGLVVPCTFRFTASPKLIKKLVKEICKKKLKQS